MPIEMIPRGEPTERELLAQELLDLRQEKTRLEEQLVRESADGVEPPDAEETREDIKKLEKQIREAENRIAVIDGTRMPDDKEGHGEMPV